MTNYQVMPDLSADDFVALKADIDARGVLVPVEYDEDGNVLDGHHRVKACEQLGLSEWPRFIRKGLSEAEKRQHARQLNLARRQLTRDQRATLWADLRREGMSYRQIAETDGTVTHQTVANSIVKNLTVDQPETITGKDGKRRAARKPIPTEFRDPSPETTAGVPRKTFVTYNSGNNEWYTPAYIIEAARSVLGSIELDPATSDAANDIVQADEYYTEEDDALSLDWPPLKIWMNPPYARGLVSEFVSKLLDTVNEGGQAIVLVNNATETDWFQRLMSAASAVCFHKGRIRCSSPSIVYNSSPLQGQAIVYIGPDVSKFYDVFGELGVVR